MSQRKSICRGYCSLVFSGLAFGFLLIVGSAGPAPAQFFNFGSPPQRQQPDGGGFGGDWFGGGGFAPFQSPRQQLPRRQAPKPVKPIVEDFSKAPSAEKRETVPERNVVVLGDGMADWLAYGLEDVYADRPDIGVVRKHKPVSGLLKYQPKGDPADWAAAAKGILATEKPDAIVVMLGLNDRVPMREPAAEKSESKASDTKAEKKEPRKLDAKPAAAKPSAKVGGETDDTATPDAKPADAEAADNETPADVAPDKSTRAPNGLYEFREERWGELYSKKIEKMIGVVKTKGVPVLWVGLPALRGTKATADMLFLNSLYREAAGKASITYVDVWDGFVDDEGRFIQQGPDFEGQTRRLRAYDGVFFTKAGARKLAHYVEREIERLLTARSSPTIPPIAPASPDAKVLPGRPSPRPLAGPVVPLVSSNNGGDQLLAGGPGARPVTVDELAARTLVIGEPLVPPAGRADHIAWPRREMELEQVRDDKQLAETSNGKTATDAPVTPPRPKKRFN